MTAYRIVWSQKAAAQRDRIDFTIRRRIVARLERAAADPERYSMRLVNSPYRRIRVGDWRVIIHVDKGELLVVVIEVAHRKDAYG